MIATTPCGWLLTAALLAGSFLQMEQCFGQIKLEFAHNRKGLSYLSQGLGCQIPAAYERLLSYFFVFLLRLAIQIHLYGKCCQQVPYGIVELD